MGPKQPNQSTNDTHKKARIRMRCGLSQPFMIRLVANGCKCVNQNYLACSSARRGSGVVVVRDCDADTNDCCCTKTSCDQTSTAKAHSSKAASDYGWSCSNYCRRSCNNCRSCRRNNSDWRSNRSNRGRVTTSRAVELCQLTKLDRRAAVLTSRAYMGMGEGRTIKRAVLLTASCPVKYRRAVRVSVLVFWTIGLGIVTT